MGEAAADPDQLARYSDELTIDALSLSRLLSGTTKSLMEQYWVSHPEMRSANASGIDEAISAVGHAHYIDQQVGVVAQAFRTAGGTGTLTDVALEKAITLNPAAHDDAYWKALEKLGTTGTDATLRDQANRELLQHQLDDLKAQRTVDEAALANAQKSGKEWEIEKAKALLDDVKHKQDILDNIQKALAEKSDQPHYLLQYDTKGPIGHSIVSTGDPFTAKNVSTIVPGTFSGGKATDTYVKDADLLLHQMGTANGSGAVIAWNGYDAPQSLVEAASPTYAMSGAAALSDFEKQLKAANPSARLTVIGHSYGTVEVSYAAMHGLHVDNVVLIASPAVPPEALAKLEAQGTHVYAARLPFDVISVADHISETIDGDAPILTPLVGTDPLNFPGVKHFHTGFAREDGKIVGGWTEVLANPKIVASIHNDYFKTPGALQNLAAISNGMPVSKPTENEQMPGRVANGLQWLVPGDKMPGLNVPMPDIPMPDIPLPNVHLPDLPEVPNPLSGLKHLADPLG